MDVFFIVFISVFAIVFAIYLFLIMPRTSHRADLELVSTDYAHRGLWNDILPENSMGAFENAIAHGYGIELDVHLSSDGKVMVFHDDTLTRMCGVKKHIESMTAQELTSTRLGQSAYTIPTFEDVLALVDGQVPLLVEIKTTKNRKPLFDALCELLDKYPGAFAVQSFDPLIISLFKKFRPRFARGQLVTRLDKKENPGMHPVLRFLLSNMCLNVLSRPDFISMDLKRTKNISYRLAVKLFGAATFIWTVRSLTDFKRVHKMGAGAIFEKIKEKF